MRASVAVLFLTAVASVVASAPPEKWEPAAKPWDHSLGSHRVILKVGELPSHTKSVAARIEWRRPDKEPEKKAVLVYDLQTGIQVPNVDVKNVTNESGAIIFEPVSGAGEYGVYFLPVKIEGGAFPVSHYLPPQKTAEEEWLKRHAEALERPQAEVVRWEAISKHDEWTEMEVIATETAVKELAARQDSGIVMLIPAKGQSVRMMDRLPDCLVRGAARTERNDLLVRPGEHLIFQLLVWSEKHDLRDISFKFSAIRSGNPSWLKAESIVCLNAERVDWNGTRSRSRLNIPRQKATPLWFSVAIPVTTGKRETIFLTLLDSQRNILAFSIFGVTAAGEPINDHGDADPQSLSRLRWLNSTTAVDDEPVKGYPPLTVTGRTIRCLGRELELGEDGLPVQIRSYFNKAVTKVMENATVEMLAVPLSFDVALAGEKQTPPSADARSALLALGKDRSVLKGEGFKLVRQTPGTVTWESMLKGFGMTAHLNGSMEFDGSVRYRITLQTSDQPVTVETASLFLVQTDTSLAMGLHHESGRTPGDFSWNWDVANKHQDSVWMGAVNGGLRVQLKADNYVRPGVNIHYKRRPLNDPPSWNAAGRGKIDFKDSPWHPLNCRSGPFTLEPGKPLHFDFDLLITPFHPLRTKEQWSERYYHTGGVPQDFNKYLDGAKAAGANVVNIHQGNWLNPYINYPFLTWEKLRDFSTAAHERGMRAKYYYTVRELSNWCPELFAFRSMGDEILMSGKGGGHPWGEEHLGGNYWQAWYEPGVQDVSFLTQPMSRFHNYYIEGLRWLCENAGCDGIYLDDIAYDRSIMLRARKALDRYCPRGGLIDLHSWNEFHEGGAWAHCANIFMDSMPFVDRLWFGEGHHYTGPPPEHFLVEISGIPFGLMGEMLEGGGNPWFGLVHGMTGRLGWQGDPRAVWKLWDDFGVQDSEFIGWWAGEECPVRCADPMVKATVWRKSDATLVAMANFAKEAKQAALAIDWKSLGRDPGKAKLYFPSIAPLRQKAALVDPRGGGFQPPTAGGQDVPATILLKPYSGAVFILDEKEHTIAAPPAPEALGAVLVEADFTRGLDQSWTSVISPRANTAGKLDAGYVLQIPANLHGFLERGLPAEAGAVSARIWQDGNDQGQQWGPGLAVVWPDGKTLRANVRHDGRLTVSENGSEDFPASITARAPVEFTIRWNKDTVKIIAAGPAMGDLPEELAAFPRDRFPGPPSLLRAGKMPNNAAPQDFSDSGPAGFNRIEWIRIHGPR